MYMRTTLVRIHLVLHIVLPIHCVMYIYGVRYRVTYTLCCVYTWCYVYICCYLYINSCVSDTYWMACLSRRCCITSKRRANCSMYLIMYIDTLQYVCVTQHVYTTNQNICVTQYVTCTYSYLTYTYILFRTHI